MRVAIKGTGITKFGELWDKSLYDLAQEAVDNAIAQAKIENGQIDAIFVANMLGGNLHGQNHLGPVVSSMLGLNCPSYSVEAACASGGIAINLACQGLEGGSFKNVLVVGVEKMTDHSTSEVTEGLMGAASEEERHAGLTFPGLYALMANIHMAKFGTTKKDLAKVAVKNHFHGALNPNAQYQNQITVEKVLGSQEVASPLTLFDCSPITDGAAAVILSSEETDGAVITASSVATDSIGLARRKNLWQLDATKIAALKAYKSAGVTSGEIDIAEVHDCFTIAEILALEDLGFCAKGVGGKFTSSGATMLGGKLPVNTSGGLKACGHPVGATGVKQLIEVATQLKGEADKRQAKGVKVGLTHNVGGSGATAAVHIVQI